MKYVIFGISRAQPITVYVLFMQIFWVMPICINISGSTLYAALGVSTLADIKKHFRVLLSGVNWV